MVEAATAEPIKSETERRKEITALVEKYLEPFQPKDHRLNVVGVRRDEDYWYVVVQPTRDDIRMYDYYNTLAEVESLLEERENVNVLVVPVLPG